MKSHSMAQTLRIAALAAACGLVALAAVPATAQVGPTRRRSRAPTSGLHAAAQKRRPGPDPEACRREEPT